MNTPAQTQPPAAGEAAHTPYRLPLAFVNGDIQDADGLSLSSIGKIEAVRACNSHAALVAGASVLGKILLIAESCSGGGEEINQIRELVRTAATNQAISAALESAKQ